MTQPPQALLDLVERFARNIDLDRSPSCSETQVRHEFIDPFFAALGWDVNNTRGVSPRYREVIHEASLRARGSVTAPDYCFRVGTERKFFVEAKKPAVSMQTDIQPAYQLRRYAWTARLPLSILTDFEEFSVYDCRFRPKPGDKASQARLLSLTYDQYPDRWDEIAGIFSREAVWKGDYDRYAETTRGKRGTQEVDREFLKEIEGWRVALARNIALRNADLTDRELNYAVQKIIDRILFLRICEDRGIEPYEQLRDIANGTESYARLLDLFRRADERFNSGIFHFREEKGRNERPDSLTPTLAVDDKVLRGIISKLYYPDSPYEFSVLSVEILGNVYEQFLGSVIRLTRKHRAVVEQKPEVRKAGGVYYTPRYIVDYIVEHTVGELCKDKTPSEIARLRILDPACGSGSFLLGAYEYLLNYHLDWYVEHPTRRDRQEVYEGSGGDWFLTTEEKKRILLNNIYGVDIDPQAVEVTKLSLLLKVLEAETRDSLGQQLELIRERALPDLASNIKCGNSLIGPDFYDGEQMSLLDEEEMYRINPFDWQAEFADVINAGGFDAVIGNPPYVSFYSRESIKPDPVVEKHLIRRFSTEVGGRKNTFLFFLVQSVRLMAPAGYVSMIVPDTLTINDSYEATRRHLTSSQLRSVARLDFPVFLGPTVRTSIPVLGPSADWVRFEVYDSEAAVHLRRPSSRVDVPRAVLLERRASKWLFSDLSVQNLLSKIERYTTPLECVAETRDGINPGPKSFRATILNPDGPPKPTWRPVVEGRHVQRFSIFPTTEIVDYDVALLTPRLKKRGCSFRDPRIFTAPKLVNRQTAATLIFGFDDVGYCTLNSVHNTRARDGKRNTLLYLLGLLNSKTLRFYYRAVSEETRDVFPQVHISALRQLPIRTIDSTDSAAVERHDRMVALVERMVALHKQLADAKTPRQRTPRLGTPMAKELLQRQIDATDRQIDRLVYELYGLTEEEIGIVEEATG